LVMSPETFVKVFERLAPIEDAYEPPAGECFAYTGRVGSDAYTPCAVQGPEVITTSPPCCFARG